MIIFNRLTRQSIRKTIPVAQTHDTPTSPIRIAQAKAERSLLDLIAACNVPGVDPGLIVNSIASRSARMDERGTRDIGDELSSISAILSDLIEPLDRMAYAIQMKQGEICDAAAGASTGGAIPQRPSDCATLPPAVIKQIDRSVKRDALRTGFNIQSIRGSANFLEASEKADRLMADHDAQHPPHTILGPGGEFTKKLYA